MLSATCERSLSDGRWDSKTRQRRQLARPRQRRQRSWHTEVARRQHRALFEHNDSKHGVEAQQPTHIVIEATDLKLLAKPRALWLGNDQRHFVAARRTEVMKQQRVRRDKAKLAGPANSATLVVTRPAHVLFLAGEVARNKQPIGVEELGLNKVGAA